ncbi:MAG: hypothetical protein WBO55_20085, partial [Rhizobiaceae bacterium]
LICRLDMAAGPIQKPTATITMIIVFIYIAAFGTFDCNFHFSSLNLFVIGFARAQRSNCFWGMVQKRKKLA